MSDYQSLISQLEQLVEPSSQLPLAPPLARWSVREQPQGLGVGLLVGFPLADDVVADLERDVRTRLEAAGASLAAFDVRTRIAAHAVQGLFLLMIAVLIVTGPLAVWSTGQPLQVFDLLAIPSPFAARVDWLHEACEEVHGAATKLFWPLIGLHVAGAVKHLVYDRDRTLQRMLWVRRA